MSITLSGLLMGVAVAAIILTGIVYFLNGKKVENWVISFLQNYCGALFIFSGFVKAVDPLGTAYKMEQYFTEFESTFEATWFSFIAPLFPFLSGFSASFSVLMIVFEILLGILLILGHWPKWTSWAFFLLVLFFTFLTGFTYLTGYVPQDVNFFSFSGWGPYVESNMKVTDCGCFGDFLKLEPKTSFLKDVALMVPAILFLLRYKTMHVLFSGKIRNIITAIGVVGFLVYCISNFSWDLPGYDFRPFNKGKNVRDQKMIEEEAMANVPIIAYRLENRQDKSVIDVPYAEYMKTFQEYKKTHDVLEQVKGKSSIPTTKISDFQISDVNGEDVTYSILDNEGYHFMIVSYKMYGDPIKKQRTLRDSIFTVDTIVTQDGVNDLVKSFDKVVESKEDYFDYTWDDTFLNNYKNKIGPLLQDAAKDNIPVYAIVGGAGEEMIEDFKSDSGLNDLLFLTADDILLKTIVRSNPGVVLWHNGVIIDKWHIKKLPSYAQIKKIMK